MIVDLALVLVLLGLAAGVGGRFAPRESDALGLLEELALGLAGLALALLLLGAVGWLRPWPIALLFVAAALFASPSLRRLPARARAALPSLESPLERVCAAVFGVFALFLVVLALAPPVDWDALMYHLDLPAEWLATGRVHLPVDNLHAVYAGAVHLLYVPLLAFGSSSAPALLSACFALLLGATIVAASARFFGRAAAALSGTWLWGTGTVLLVAATARIDVTLAFFLLLAQVVLLRALVEEGSGPLLVRAALLLGCAGGIKFHALGYGAALAPVFAWALFRRVDRARRARIAALAVAAAAIPVLPWLAKNWLLVGNPLYPLGAQPALDTWLADLYRGGPGPDWSSFDSVARAREVFSLWLAFVAPGRLSVELEAAHYRLSPGLLFALLWLGDRRRASVNALLGPALLYVALVLAYSSTTNLRYLVPAVPPLAMAAAGLLTRKVTARPLLAIALILGLVPGAITLWTWATKTAALPYALDRVSSERFLQTHLDSTVRGLASAVALVDAHVPREGRVLLLFEARGFAFPRRVLQDNRIRNWPLLAGKWDDSCLAEIGVTHVLVNRGSLSYYLRRGLTARGLRLDELEKFAATCLEPVDARPGFELYRLGVARDPAPRPD